MKLGVIFLVLLVGIPVFFVGWMIKVDIEITNNVSAWYDRASNAPTAERMTYFLDELTSSMDRYEMTSRYAALVYKNPKNDMAVTYSLLLELRDRTIEVEQYPKGSMDYAESMGELIQRMHDFEFDSFWWYCVNRTPKAVLAWWMLAYLVLLGPLLILAMVTWDTDPRCILGKHTWSRRGKCRRCGCNNPSWSLRDELEVETPRGRAKVVVSTIPDSGSEYSEYKTYKTTVSGTVEDKKLVPYHEKNWGREKVMTRHDDIIVNLRRNLSQGKFTLEGDKTEVAQ